MGTGGARTGRTTSSVSGLVESGLDLQRGPAAHQLDGDRVPWSVRVDRDRQLFGAAHRRVVDGDDDVLLLNPGQVAGTARLDVEHEGTVASAVGHRAGVHPERG